MRRALAFLLSCAAALVSAQSPEKQLVELAAAGGGVINLNSQTFELLTSAKRTWSASIQFTAQNPKRGCKPCLEFDPSWNQVANAWTKVPTAQKDQHFFATLDFDGAPAIFQRLSIATAPVVFIFPPTDGPRKAANPNPMKYDFSEGFDAGPLAEQMSKFTPVPIPYSPPFNWKKWGTLAAGAATFAVALRFIGPIVTSRWTWAFGCIVTSLIMTSGYMFTKIRNSPFVARDGNWLAAGFSNQFGQEVFVIAFVYGLLAVSFLMLILVVPLQKSASRQRLQVYIWTGVIIIIYSVLVSIFKVKNKGYPYRLFL
ncbi:dolichyl-diphosphooligosaccharide-protein glycotransferase [Coprinopsis sp. MPI-PUGE-AT-0042]|nr:dolichyl-diphosphooligosaccharide-protein glycotransferase [Coprinopsis sp. MPI-PUGE-AT-0042]